MFGVNSRVFSPSSANSYYEIRDHLGKGVLGFVYKARNANMNSE